MHRQYFEGWYLKHSGKNGVIAFIPSIHEYEGKKTAMLQIVAPFYNEYLEYPGNKIKIELNPFYLKIDDNEFTENYSKLNITTDTHSIKGEIQYEHPVRLVKSIFNPGIMGPFSYIPFMECRHDVLSLNHDVSGYLQIDGKNISMDNCLGYIEKDSGRSFPKDWLWLQCNNFPGFKTSIMVAIAKIPYLGMNFHGIICCILHENKQYRLATYNGAKVFNLTINDKSIYTHIENKNFSLYIKAQKSKPAVLKAPIKGKMSRDVTEIPSTDVSVLLNERGKEVFNLHGKNCGLEYNI
ncbi:MAG: tocopherol cyclase family protein [Clostridiales bacterium]|jgi:hypothetical protein|nr:tocopherol cyclase family protein [Clostridiales bacterium]